MNSRGDQRCKQAINIVVVRTMSVEKSVLFPRSAIVTASVSLLPQVFLLRVLLLPAPASPSPPHEFPGHFSAGLSSFSAPPAPLSPSAHPAAALPRSRPRARLHGRVPCRWSPQDAGPTGWDVVFSRRLVPRVSAVPTMRRLGFGDLSLLGRRTQVAASPSAVGVSSPRGPGFAGLCSCPLQQAGCSSS